MQLKADGCRWAAALGGSFAVVSRNKYQTFTQKLVQARVYAQGGSPSRYRGSIVLTGSAWTIALLLVAAFISGTGVAESDTVALRPGDHSWREILGEYNLNQGH